MPAADDSIATMPTGMSNTGVQNLNASSIRASSPDLATRRCGSSRPSLTIEKALATVVWMLDNPYIRIGNAAYAEANRSYRRDAQDRHVKVEGGSVKVRVQGKSGKEWNLAHNDRRIANVVRSFRNCPASTSSNMSVIKAIPPHLLARRELLHPRGHRRGVQLASFPHLGSDLHPRRSPRTSRRGHVRPGYRPTAQRGNRLCRLQAGEHAVRCPIFYIHPAGLRRTSEPKTSRRPQAQIQKREAY